MKIVNRVGPSMDPWQTPLVAGFQLEKELFTTTLGAALSQFPTHYTDHLSKLKRISLEREAMENHIKSLVEIQVDNVHRSSPPSTKQVTLSQKQICFCWFVKSLVNLCWLFPIMCFI